MYNVDEIRKHFPMLNGDKKMQGKPLVYLDNASTTFKPQCVIDAMNDYYMNRTANSHRGDYDLLYDMDQEVLKTRKAVARFVNCEWNEVAFTSGDTQALNFIAKGFAKKILKPGDEIILSYEEHASNLLPWYDVAKQTGAKIVFVPLGEDGLITCDKIKKVLSNKTRIVSLAHVSNVLGYEIDVKEIAKLVHSVGAYFVVDGAQSVPHIKTDFKGWDIDFLSIAGHKMCAPTGTGCLIGKYELLDMMDCPNVGGGMNVDFTKKFEYTPLNPPEKFEAGTQNVSGIMGLRAAIEFLESIGVENIHEHDKELVEYAFSRLEKCDKVILYNRKATSGIICFNIKDVFPQDEATLLNYKGIAVRSGQHCAKILHNFLGTKATCRISTYLYTSKEEIDKAIDAIINGGDILDAYFSD